LPEVRYLDAAEVFADEAGMVDHSVRQPQQALFYHLEMFDMVKQERVFPALRG